MDDSVVLLSSDEDDRKKREGGGENPSTAVEWRAAFRADSFFEDGKEPGTPMDVSTRGVHNPTTATTEEEPMAKFSDDEDPAAMMCYSPGRSLPPQNADVAQKKKEQKSKRVQQPDISPNPPGKRRRKHEQDQVKDGDFEKTAISACVARDENGGCFTEGKLAREEAQQVPMIKVQDEFFGVYCLISRSPLPHYKNRCYIGFTVDPNRRIRQHNGGKEKGGAKKTDNRGPWDMVCVIHGFPNSIAALRFEWAWQNPEKTRALGGLKLRKRGQKETPFAFRLRVACHLLASAPWNRMSLFFRWLKEEAEISFPKDAPEVKNAPLRRGLVIKTETKVEAEESAWRSAGSCAICEKTIERIPELVRCCDEAAEGACGKAHFHARCLARQVLGGEKGFLFPTEGLLPCCGRPFRWGDLIRDQRKLVALENAAKNGGDERLHQFVGKIGCFLKD